MIAPESSAGAFVQQLGQHLVLGSDGIARPGIYATGDEPGQRTNERRFESHCYF